MSSRIVDVNGGQFQIDVSETGSGDPLLYLHGIAGKQEGEFIAKLAASHRVIAPWIPGFGGSTGSEEIADFHDLIYLYLDLLDELDLRDLPIVGHSLGGMLAAELAAVQPDRFSKVVLIGALGLWDQDNQVMDFFTVPPSEFAEAMYADQKSEAALDIATTPQSRLPEVDPETDEGKEVIDYYVERAKSMSTAAKYLWPIPNKGLSKHDSTASRSQRCWCGVIAMESVRRSTPIILAPLSAILPSRSWRALPTWCTLRSPAKFPHQSISF